MIQDERVRAMYIAGIILQELEEAEQDAFMCASIETLADKRNMSPFDLMKQYVKAMIEVNFNEDKRK